MSLSEAEPGRRSFSSLRIGVTSATTYLVGIKRFGRSGSTLPQAVGRMLECAGMTLIFLVINGAAAATVALSLRFLLAKFGSMYLAGEATLLDLSLLQALTFQGRHALSTRSPA